MSNPVPPRKLSSRPSMDSANSDGPTIHPSSLPTRTRSGGLDGLNESDQEASIERREAGDEYNISNESDDGGVDHSLNIEEEEDEDDDENSTIMHSENPNGHRVSFSQSFLSPPPVYYIPTDEEEPMQLPIVQEVASPDSAASLTRPRYPPTTPYDPPNAAPPAAATAAAAAASSSSAPLHSPPTHASSASMPDLSSDELHALTTQTRRQSHGPCPPSKPPLPPSKEDADTIDYYLRQALAAKDHAAMRDLVDRATEKRLQSDLVSQARSTLADRATEERENEVATLKHYMKQSLASRRVEPIRDVLRKVEPVAAAIAAGPHRRLHGDLFALVDESHSVLSELEKEDAQTVSAYLRQGVQTRSREVLQAALAKSATVRHELIDEHALAQAKTTLADLDASVLVRNFLQLAIKNRDESALSETLAQAAKIGLADDVSEVTEARRTLEEIRLTAQPRKAKAEKDARQQQEKQEKEAKKLAEKQEKQDQKAAAAAATDSKSKDRTKWFGSSSSKDKKPSTSASSSSSSSSKSLLFGGPLSVALHRNPSSRIPRVCEECMSYIRQHGTLEPGIFRVAGNKEQIDGLRKEFEQVFTNTNENGQIPDTITIPTLTEVHDAAGLLKLYFRLLPEPLIPYDLYDRFIKIGLNKGPDRIAQLQTIIKQLPKENIVVMDELFRFLLEVSSHQSVNKMSPDNLAIVFAPNLLRPKVETPAALMTEMPTAISVIASLCAEHDTIFQQETTVN